MSETAMYLYPSLELPELPDLPEWDKESYPYAYMLHNDHYWEHLGGTIEEYRIVFTKHPMFFNGEMLEYPVDTDTTLWAYYLKTPPDCGTPLMEWVYEGVVTRVKGTTSFIPIWVNTDVLDRDGSIYLSATTPVLARNGMMAYKGVIAPKLPEWDKSAYPYATIFLSNSSYFLRLTEVPFWYGRNYVANGYDVFHLGEHTDAIKWGHSRYDSESGMWSSYLFDEGVMPLFYASSVWANYNIYEATGSNRIETDVLYLSSYNPILLTNLVTIDNDYIRGYKVGQQLRYNLTFCQESYSVGIVAINTVANPGVIYRITTPEQAVETFGTEGYMADLAKLALQNGAPEVVCVAVTSKELTEYGSAYDLLCKEKDVAILICDSTSLTNQQKMRDAIHSNLLTRYNRIGIAANTNGELVETVGLRADGLFSPWVMCLYSGKDFNTAETTTQCCYLAACVAGVLSKRHLVKDSCANIKLEGIDVHEYTPIIPGKFNQLIFRGVSTLLIDDTGVYVGLLQDTHSSYGIPPLKYKPQLFTSSSWYGGSTPKSSITSIKLTANYIPTGLETDFWLSTANYSKVLMCIVDNELIISSCEYDSFDIYIGSNSTNIFSGFTNVKTIDLTLVELSNTKTYNLSKMFYNCKSLQSVYVSNKWNPSEKCIITDMFTNCGVSEVTYIN